MLPLVKLTIQSAGFLSNRVTPNLRLSAPQIEQTVHVDNLKASNLRLSLYLWSIWNVQGLKVKVKGGVNGEEKNADEYSASK